MTSSFRHRINPVVEIHPYIRSRMLKPEQVPTQLKNILKSQMLHTAFFGDFENLFLQAVLIDDYELAKSIMEKCRFSERHQQVVNFYKSATRIVKKYEASL